MTRVFEGSFVQLLPMDLSHAEGLASIAFPDLYKFFLGDVPMGSDRRSGEIYVQAVTARSKTETFTVIRKADGMIVGSTSFLDINPSQRSLEIGSTWISLEAQGTGINPEMKLLLLQEAFEVRNCVRVQLKTDSRNLQSQAAISKLGATREGILRNFGILRDGYVRDAVIYSITDKEWPEVKSRLLARLDRLSG